MPLPDYGWVVVQEEETRFILQLCLPGKVLQGVQEAYKRVFKGIG